MSTNAITNRLTSNVGRWVFDAVLLLVIITLANSLIWVLWTSWVEPVILTDELTFALQILEDPSNVLYSNQLHTLVYGSLANACGTDWYLCGRVLNQVLWASTGVLVFLSFRVHISNIASIGFALVQQLSGLAIFTSTTMPEVLYIFLVALGLLFISAYFGKQHWWLVTLAGVSFGLAALAKPHALILGMFVFIVFSLVQIRGRDRLVAPLLFIASLMLGRLIAGFAIGGLGAINFLGSYFPFFVGLRAENSLTASSLFVEQYSLAGLTDEDGQSLVWEALWLSLPGYLVAGTALFGASIALLSARLMSGERMQRIDKFVAVIVGAATLMLLASWLFGAYVSGAGDDHSDRALLRYSEFLAPIALGYLLYELLREDGAFLRTRVVTSSLLIAPTFIISSGAVDGLTLFISDSTVFAGYVQFGLVYLLFSVVIGTALLWNAKNRNIKSIESGIGLALVLLMSMLTLDSFAGTYRDGTLQNSAAKFLEDESWADRSTMFLGVERYRGAAALMIRGQLDQKYTRMTSGSVVSAEQLEDREQLLTMGDFYFDQSLRLVGSEAGIHLLEPSRDGSSSVLMQLNAPEVTSIKGLGAHAPWGGLATQENVIIRFKETLQPGNVIKIVVIRHPNATANTYGLELNGSEFEFAVERASEPTTIEIALQERVDFMTIQTPLHQSGMNPVTSTPFSLGLGIASISVE